MKRRFTRREHPWLRRFLCRLGVHTIGCDGRMDHWPRTGRWVPWNVG